ncbi:MAG TPA: hypothetical protein ENN29_01835, partial [Candidatus Hydrogenedentes bacterium]|nr:hypothetical protein [Candidatus Hydrogenedentota bacterium]
AAKPKATVKPKAKTAAKPKATVKPKAKTAAEKMEVKKKTVAKSVSKKAAKQKATPAKALKAASKTTGKAPASQSQVVPSPARSKTAKDDVVAAEAQATGQRRQSGANLKFLVSVAQAIKDAVAPIAKAVKGREVVDEAPSGDVTFLLDRVAEKALFTRLKAAALPIAYYSEHEGYSTFSSKAPKALLIVDPIDGTRAAKSGFEGCVVAVASTRVIERPTIADVDCACVMDLLGDRIFLAERGKGARVYVGGRLKRPKLSDNIDLESMIWSMTIPARPAELVFPTAARIIDLSSLKGGFFACNSTSFSLTRLVTSQLDACVDIANRYYRDIPDRVEDYFINAGRGKVIGVAPYDIAASLLIAREAGCIVTDAYGKNFDDLLLLDSSKGNHQSIIAASNEQLHEKLLSFFDTRIRQYELLLTRHTSGE